MNGPIFLGGVANSGKTLLRLALSSHPRLAISRRTYMWTRFYNRYGDLRDPGNFERCLSAMLAHKHTQALDPDPDRIRREFWLDEPGYPRLFALIHRHYAERLGRPRWGDQLGFVEHYAGIIFSAYPDAMMIHMVRDPRDGYAESIVGVRRQRRPGSVGSATARWLHSASLARHNRQLYPDRYKVVRYEVLVSRFEETLRDICSFLGEEFLPRMLTMEGALRFGSRNHDEPPGACPSSLASNVRRKWRGSGLSRREATFIHAFAGESMAALGYEVEPVVLSARERLLCYGVDWPVNLAGMVAQRMLLRRQLN